MAKKKEKFKLKECPLTEAQIKMFVEHYNKNGSFPGSKIPCNITGKLTTCVGPWLKKKVAEFGSAEALLRNYKCRGVNKAKKAKEKETKLKVSVGAKKKQKKKETKEDDLTVIPQMNVFERRPSTDFELTAITRDACLRPDIFLDNDRFCNGCEYLDLCSNTNKCLKKTAKKSLTSSKTLR